MTWQEILIEVSPYLVSVVSALCSFLVCFLRTRHKKLHDETKTTCVDLSQFYVLDHDGKEINLGDVTIHKKR